MNTNEQTPQFKPGDRVRVTSQERVYKITGAVGTYIRNDGSSAVPHWVEFESDNPSSELCFDTEDLELLPPDGILSRAGHMSPEFNDKFQQVVDEQAQEGPCKSAACHRQTVLDEVAEYMERCYPKAGRSSAMQKVIDGIRAGNLDRRKADRRQVQP